MVSVPSIGKAAPFLDFETSVFKKEKVTLAGNDEVFIPVTVDFVSLSLSLSPSDKFHFSGDGASLIMDACLDISISFAVEEIYSICCRKRSKGSSKLV